MNKIKDHENLNEKKVLLRLDLNVPLKDGKITDQTRIDKILPIIEFLLKKNSKIIVISHIGRPKGRVDKNLSLRPVCKYLEKKINRNVKIIDDDIFKLKKEDFFKNSKDQIVFLENIRFYEEEEKNDINFSKHLASLADLFINDAFSCSHRAHSSVSKITEFLPSFAGLQLETEINALKKVTTEIKKPITCIIGGSKISTKLKVLENLTENVDKLFVGGGMANTFLLAKGFKIGKSLCERSMINTANNILLKAEKNNCEIVLPIDALVAKDMEKGTSFNETSIDKIPSDALILDIGSKTISKITDILQEMSTVVWCGPLGLFELNPFQTGTVSIAKEISMLTKNKKIISVAGGGDTVAALSQSNYNKDFTYISTAGGAFLELLAGEKLPGLEVLRQ
jgi:phosphoglycerate kinase